MRKFGIFLLTIPFLIGCSANSVKTETYKHVNEPIQIIFNVNYTLQPTKVTFYKTFEEKNYQWEYSYDKVNFLRIESYLRRDITPTEYSLSSEEESYSWFSLFYIYGNMCVMVENL